jgi:putative chitinase
MSVITAAHIRAAAKSRVNEGNMNSVLVALEKFGLGLGLNRPHRVAHYLAQLIHETDHHPFRKRSRHDFGDSQPRPFT